MIDSASPEMQATDQVGKDAILSHLYQLNLIGLYKSHSAYEKVGLRFCEEEFEPVLDEIFRNFLPILQFYSSIRMFRTAKLDNTKPIRAIFYTLWKYQKGITHYIKERSNASKLTKPEKIANLHKACDEYVSRMNGNQFYGGETPDAVDFRVFSVLDRVKHTSVILNLFKARSEDQRFEVWFKKMLSLCEKKSTF